MSISANRDLVGGFYDCVFCDCDCVIVDCKLQGPSSHVSGLGKRMPTSPFSHRT